MFKRFFRKLRDFFVKDKPVVIRPPKVEAKTPQRNTSGSTIGIVVGHNKRAQGASNYLDESEWVFNSRIAKKLQVKLAEAGVNSVVVYRPERGGYSHEVSSVIRQLKDFACKFSIHLHFNSAGAGAMGCEVLVADTRDTYDNAWGKVFSDMLNETYGFRERGNDGVKTLKPKHRGATMLYAAKRAGITGVLPEPCFGDYRTKESALIFEQEDKYVDVLRDAVVRTWQ